MAGDSDGQRVIKINTVIAARLDSCKVTSQLDLELERIQSMFSCHNEYGNDRYIVT